MYSHFALWKTESAQHFNSEVLSSRQKCWDIIGFNYITFSSSLEAFTDLWFRILRVLSQSLKLLSVPLIFSFSENLSNFIVYISKTKILRSS